MLLTRALPPAFLLPSWGARQLAQKLQRACLSESASRNPLTIRKFKPKRTKRPKSPQVSLFDELFPEEKNPRRDDKELEVDKLPPFQFDHSVEKQRAGFTKPPLVAGKGATESDGHAEKHSHPATQSEHDDEKRRREAAVLVLNSASKRLEESDFFRIGHKGVHIQGWTTGIIKGMDCVLYNKIAKLSWC